MKKPVPTLRTKKTAERYEKRKEKTKDLTFCPLCQDKALKSFRYWKIIKNDFPYDKIAKTHHMIAPFRHVKENGLNKKELKEFKDIKKNYINNGKYHMILEALRKYKTKPNHFHLHLIVLK